MKYALLIRGVPRVWNDLGDEERTAIMGEYPRSRDFRRRRREPLQGGSAGHHGPRSKTPSQ